MAASKPASAPASPRDAARLAIERGVAYLQESQNADGSWGGARNAAHPFWSNPETHRSWQVATTGLACMALLESAAGPDATGAVDRGLEWIVANADLKRPSDWDTDNTWGFIYGLQALAYASKQPSLAAGPRRAAMLAGCDQFVAKLAKYQSPNGGWGYYADPEAAWRSEWATSFMTAVGVLALLEARGAGVKFDDAILDKAVHAVERCKLPNGAYSYDVMAIPRTGWSEGINQVKGSLGRIQVCGLALHLAKSPKVTLQDMRWGLEQFFEHHRFLDVARMKPIPHEAYYQNAGYFYFFGHYYAALVLEQLPPAERAAFAGRLQREIMKTQESDGSMWDFYTNTYHRPWGTSFGMMALGKTLPPPG